MAKQTLRCPGYDYRRRGVYMVTLTKAEYMRSFSTLCRLEEVTPEMPVQRILRYTKSGHAVLAAIRHLPDTESAILVLQYAVMPDHCHILIRVLHDMEDPLGNKIAAFKTYANRIHKEETGDESPLFAPDFNDQIIWSNRNLGQVYKYVRENPYRLAVRKLYPEYFSRVLSTMICGESCHAYGNLLLLRCPIADQIVVHRADDEERFGKNLKMWEYTASGGGVLVSPFISPREKRARDAILAQNGKIILITDVSYGEREKPGGALFDLCTQGRLLVITPERIERSTQSYREKCLSMNAYAQRLVDAMRDGKAR